MTLLRDLDAMARHTEARRALRDVTAAVATTLAQPSGPSAKAPGPTSCSHPHHGAPAA